MKAILRKKRRILSCSLDLYLFRSTCRVCWSNTRIKHHCRRGRVTIAEKEAIAQDTEDALIKKELEAEERRKQSHNLVAESIKRELAESQ